MKDLSSKAAKFGFLGKFIKKKPPKIQVISYDKLLYTRILGIYSGEINEEVLFDKACAELGLANAYIYAMSYALSGENADIFLTSHENLDENCDFSLPEPLILANLNAASRQIPSDFALLVLAQSYGYGAFYAGGALLELKNIPQFSLKHLKNKDEAQILAFVEDKILEKAKFKALCEKFKSKKLVFMGDELGVAEILEKRLGLPIFKAHKFTPNSLNLGTLEAQKTSNFLRNKIKNNFAKNLMLGFICAAILGFGVILGEFFVKKYTLTRSFGDASSLNLEDLQRKNAKNSDDLELLREISAKITKEFTPFDILATLKSLFELCFEQGIKVQSVEISPSQIKLLIDNDEKSAKFIKELYANALFSLKSSEVVGEWHELILERR